jgi:ariadne-1
MDRSDDDQNDDEFDYADSGGNDDVDDDDGFEYDSQELGSNEQPPALEVISEVEAGERQQSLIVTASATLGLPNTGSVALLLRRSKWDIQALQQLWAAKADRLQLLEDAGVPPVSIGRPGDNDTAITCSVCFDSMPRGGGKDLGCGHWFCGGCWAGNLAARLDGGKFECLDTTCMDPKCKYVVDPVVFATLCEPEDRARYRERLRQAFVTESAHFQWCPAARCERVVVVPRPRENGCCVGCDCGQQFCMRCSASEWHSPASCEQHQIWTARDVGADTLDKKYIRENSKLCPKCSIPTEKASGCMYLCCSSCNTHWCWQCGQYTGGPGTNGGPVHHVYDCNQTVQQAWKEKCEGDQDERRYQAWYARFVNHREARGFAVSLANHQSKAANCHEFLVKF